MRILKYVVLCNLSLFIVFSAFSQDNNNPTKKEEISRPSADEIMQMADSLEIGPDEIMQLIDSLNISPEQLMLYADSLGMGLKSLPFIETLIPSDSVSLDSLEQQIIKKQGDIETTVVYSARDSMFFDLETQDMFLYGESKITYGEIELEAENIEINWVKNILNAKYELDSSNVKVGKPVFRQGEEQYTTDNITYNFKTEKAIIRGVITEQDGAFMHGDRVKKNEKDEMFIRDALYTTCNLEEPHFSIHSKKLKVIPNNKVVSGPFRLYFAEIPTILSFPFGMFPQPKEKASGIIVPQYGEDASRGFFLREGGYYFDISDYINLTLTGEIYSRGSYGLNARSTYRKRYAYSGNFNVRYNKSVTATLNEIKPFSQDFWVQWSHSPQSKGTSRFSASVSAGTSSFSQNANLIRDDFSRSINAQFNSSVSFSKTFRGFNMAVNARHNQNVQTGLVNVTLPEMTLNANRVYIFKNSPKLSKGILGKLGFSYSMTAKNDLTNAPKRSTSNFNVVNKGSLDDSLVSFSPANASVLFDRAKNGMRHNIPISTSFNLFKYFTVSPSFNYTELWYPRELKYTYVPELEGVRIDTVRGFSRAGSYSSGASVNTRIYGFLPVGGKKIQAIRHVMTPSIGFSFSPDFGAEKYGYYQDVQIDETGRTATLSKYEGFAYGSPGRGESASMSFSLSNNLEMKVKTKNDSIDEFKKVKIFDNLSFSSGYNFAADSFRLSNISMSARTSLFNRLLSLSVNGTVDPYVYRLDSVKFSSGGRKTVYDTRIDRYAWNNGNGLGQLSRGTVSMGFSLSPKSKKKKNTDQEDPDDNRTRGFDPNDLTDPNNPYSDPYDLREGVRNGEFVGQPLEQYTAYNDANQYVDFSIPWNLRANYSFNYSKSGFQDSRITQSLSFSGNISITEKTKIGFNSGYDIKKGEFTVTRLNLSRDLHCWTLNFNWVPFGVNQSYFVEIRVLSTLLSDLKLDKQSRPVYRGGFR
ncbi:MAG: LPS-assembly protein LptD [Cyclobacteriaceae bacterium]